MSGRSPRTSLSMIGWQRISDAASFRRTIFVFRPKYSKPKRSVSAQQSEKTSMTSSVSYRSNGCDWFNGYSDVETIRPKPSDTGLSESSSRISFMENGEKWKWPQPPHRTACRPGTSDKPYDSPIGAFQKS